MDRNLAHFFGKRVKKPVLTRKIIMKTVKTVDSRK